MALVWWFLFTVYVSAAIFVFLVSVNVAEAQGRVDGVRIDAAFSDNSGRVLVRVAGPESAGGALVQLCGRGYDDVGSLRLVGGRESTVGGNAAFVVYGVCENYQEKYVTVLGGPAKTWKRVANFREEVLHAMDWLQTEDAGVEYGHLSAGYWLTDAGVQYLYQQDSSIIDVMAGVRLEVGRGPVSNPGVVPADDGIGGTLTGDIARVFGLAEPGAGVVVVAGLLLPVFLFSRGIGDPWLGLIPCAPLITLVGFLALGLSVWWLALVWLPILVGGGYVWVRRVGN